MIEEFPDTRQFDRIEQLIAWARGRPRLSQVESWDIADADLRAARAMVLQLDRLGRQYPELVGMIERVELVDLMHPCGVVFRRSAQGCLEGVTLQLSTVYWELAETLYGLLRDRAEEDWTPQGLASVSYLMSHEVGHIADDSLTRAMRRGDSIERWRRGLSRRHLRGISRQAEKYPKEQAFAEAFALAHHVPLDDWPQAVRWLMELMHNAGT